MCEADATVVGASFGNAEPNAGDGAETVVPPFVVVGMPGPQQQQPET